MDQHLRQLKRATLSSPDDVAGLHRYIVALERVIGGVQPAEPPKRSGWKCPDPDSPPGSPGSPDGICAYYSDPPESGVGLRTVALIIDGKHVDWPLPVDYIARESDDWCIFCGDPEERK